MPAAKVCGAIAELDRRVPAVTMGNQLSSTDVVQLVHITMRSPALVSSGPALVLGSLSGLADPVLATAGLPSFPLAALPADALDKGW